MRSLINVCEQALASRMRPPSAAVPAALSARLSAREREIVDYLRLGYTNREIASACGTSFRTVRNQLSSVPHATGDFVGDHEDDLKALAVAMRTSARAMSPGPLRRCS